MSEYMYMLNHAYTNKICSNQGTHIVLKHLKHLFVGDMLRLESFERCMYM